MVDHTALKVNQTGIIVMVLVAFAGSLFFWPLVWLIPVLAVILLAGTFDARLALFKQLYFQVLKPRGVLAPRPVQESGAPHNFAQGLGGVFLVVATILLAVNASAALGLALSLLVAALAFVNLAFGYCVGCQIYFLLGRAGVLKPS